MIRLRGLLTVVGLICTSLVTLLPPLAEAAEGDLRLIAQSFNIAADGSLTATIAMPAKLAETDLSTAVMAVAVEQRVEKREDLGPIISRTMSRPDDTVAISPACCAGPGPGEFTFSIPLEIAEVRPDALSIPRAGLYPVTIAVQREGRVVSTVLTFINRLPAAGDDGSDDDQLSVGVAIGTQSAVHLDSKGTTGLNDAATVEEMTNLADTLDALNVSGTPSTVRVEPAVLNGLQQLDQPLFARLIASLQPHQVTAEPEWPIDPSAAAAAGQGPLYTTWLRDGRARLGLLGLGPSSITTSTIVAGQPISGDGAALRFELGAALMVMTPKMYDNLEGTIFQYSDYKGELISALLPNNRSFDVAIVDHTISKLLVDPLATAELTRIYAVANLLALRQGIETSGENLQRRAVVIATPDLGVPDAGLIGSITRLIAETPGLTTATLDDVGFRTDRLLIEGEEKPVALPSVDGRVLTERIFRKAKLNEAIDAVASMLPDDSERPRAWRDLTELLPSSALNDAGAEKMDSTIRAELAEIRAAVQVPTAYTINLPGSRSTVRLRFVNNSDVPLLIKVQLTSPPGKLVFANDAQPVLLPPGEPTNVAIDVRALSNGTSGVSLDVFTPNDVPLVDTVPLKFRVNAIGVGNAITIALFGLVVLWWLQHMRSVRRKRRRAVPATLPDL
ncbi:MAG: DUF6049 family protein [Ilumatobacteraceae bacterium]